MNLAQARVVLRPRSTPEVFDLALRFTVAARGVLLRLALITIVPALGLLLALYELDVVYEPHELWLVAALLTPWIVGVHVIASSRLLFESKPPLRAILGHFLRRVVVFTVASAIVVGLIAFGALFAVGAPIFAALFLFYIEAALLEGQGPFAALGRARRLLRYRFGAALLYVLGLAAAILTFVAAAESLGHAIVRFVLQLGQPFGDLEGDGISAFSILGFFLALPYVAAVHFLAYIDVRTRQDGWDLQVRFMGLAAGDELGGDADASASQAALRQEGAR
ncbi:MAG: hypothetical protein R3B09_03635 [Nannocystaceae bacterium]